MIRAALLAVVLTLLPFVARAQSPVSNNIAPCPGLTANVILKANGANGCSASSLSDNGSAVSFSEPLQSAIPPSPSTGQTFLTLTGPNTGSSGAFQIGAASFLDNPDGLPDNVVSMGWNIAPNGAPLISGQPASRVAWESHFDVNGIITDPDLELHVASYYDQSGVEYRPITTDFLYLQKQANVTIDSQEFVLADSTSHNEYFACNALGSSSGSGANCGLFPQTTISVLYNNVAFLRQYNASGSTTLALPYINASNLLQIGEPLASPVQIGGTDVSISRTGAASVAIGNGTAGNSSAALTAGHYSGGGSAPMATAGAGAGTSPTISLANAHDAAFDISVLTGTAPTASAAIATVNFALAYSAAHCIFSPTNANAASLSSTSAVYGAPSSSNTSSWTLTAGSTALGAATTYTWSVACLGP